MIIILFRKRIGGLVEHNDQEELGERIELLKSIGYPAMPMGNTKPELTRRLSGDIQDQKEL